MVMAAQLNYTGMKADCIALPIQDSRTEVVMDDDPGAATPVLKGMDMSPEEVLQRLVEEKLEIAGTGIRERKDETGEAPAGPSDLDFAEVSPIDLGLLAGEHMQPEKRFRPGRPQACDDTAQRNDAA